MGKYTVKHACGHTSDITLFGKHDGRWAQLARLEKQNCINCRAATSGLEGTPKQCAWASDIREDFVARHPELADAAGRIVSAKAWIDSQNDLVGFVNRYS